MNDGRLPQRPTGAPQVGATTRLIAFLKARMVEDLARIWARDPDERTDGPGMAAQVGAVDEVLTTLAAGRLPEPRELRLLLYGYGRHPEYDPIWSGQLRR